jgi:hypothetical protein
MEEPSHQILKLKVGAPVPGFTPSASPKAQPPPLPESQPPPLPVAKPQQVDPVPKSLVSKIFSAQPCIYCGKPVSFLSSKHPECEASARDARKAICEQIVRYLQEGDASQVSKASIDALARHAGLSATEALNEVKRGFDFVVRNILKDRVISDEEEARFSGFMDGWNFQQSDLDQQGSWTKVVQSFVIRDLLNGKVPDRCHIQNSPLLLGKNESYVWVFNRVDVYQRKTHRSYAGHHAGFSVRIAKGVYLREGAYRGHPVEHISTDHLGRGDLVLTNKNVFFVIDGQTRKLSLKKIVSVIPHSDGISFQCDGARVSQYSIRHLDAWFAYNVVTNLSALG